MNRVEFSHDIKEKSLIETNCSCVVCGSIPIQFCHIDKNRQRRSESRINQLD